MDRFNLSGLKARISIVLFFTLPLFLIFLADSILSYIFPIIVETKLSSNLLMGIVISASSLVGVVCDLIFPQLLRGRTWKFQLILGIILSMFFPIALFISDYFAAFVLFLLASMIWGVYYELLLFAQQEFVVAEEKSKSYSKDWGILFGITQITWIIGPIMGAFLIDQVNFTRLATILFLQLLALIFTLILIMLTSYHKKIEDHEVNKKNIFSLARELGYWGILSRAVLPVLIMGVVTEVIEATYWTLGGLFGKQVAESSGMDWIIMISFSAPLILGSIVLAKLDIKNHKKLVSQISLLICGILLSCVGLLQNNLYVLLGVIFSSSVFFAFSSPLNEAVYSDLLGRINKGRQLHLLGLAKANSSVAYIITPVFVGFIADKTNYHTTFSLIGLFAIVTAIFLLIITPRKIHLPEKEINKFD